MSTCAQPFADCLSVCLVCSLFSADLPAGPAEYPNEPPSTYKGAKVMLPGEAPAANVILAFEYGGGWRDIQVRLLHPWLQQYLGALLHSLWLCGSFVGLLHAPCSCSTAQDVCVDG